MSSKAKPRSKIDRKPVSRVEYLMLKTEKD
jgi:hypothetical protein